MIRREGRKRKGEIEEGKGVTILVPSADFKVDTRIDYCDTQIESFCASRHEHAVKNDPHFISLVLV